MSRMNRVPDVILPAGIPDWAAVHNVLALDLATIDSGAAFLSDGRQITTVSGEALLNGGVPLLPVEDLAAVEYELAQALHSPAGWPLDKRIHAIFTWVSTMGETLPIDVVVTESHPYAQGMKRGQAAVDGLAMARGAAMVAAREWGIPCVSFPAHHVKALLCGSQSAPKEDIQKAVLARGYVVPHKANGALDDNVADALALGHAVSELIKQERQAQRLQPAQGRRK